MRAMMLDEFAPVETRPLVLRDVPRPAPGPEEILLRVLACGVCRTDLHIVEGDIKPALPRIPGHQIVGTVEQKGSGCSRFAPGDRVGAAWLGKTCERCEYCLRGAENLCPESSYTGFHTQGGYAEFTTVVERYAYKVPDVFDAVSATPLLCAGIIGFRALEKCALPEGGSLGIYGFGSSAHVVIQLARARRHEVLVATRDPVHREFARELGAAWVGEATAPLGARVDAAIVFAPSGAEVPPALESLEPGGSVVLAGIYMTDIPALGYERFLFHERCLRSVESNTREDGLRLLAEAAEIPVRCRTEVFPLTRANDALLKLKRGMLRGTAVLVMN